MNSLAAAMWSLGYSSLSISRFLFSGARPTWCGPQRRILLPRFEPLAPSVPPQLSSSPLSAGEFQPSGGAFPPEDPCYCPLLSGKEEQEAHSGSPQLPGFSSTPPWWAERKPWFKEVSSLRGSMRNIRAQRQPLKGPKKVDLSPRTFPTIGSLETGLGERTHHTSRENFCHGQQEEIAQVGEEKPQAHNKLKTNANRWGLKRTGECGCSWFFSFWGDRVPWEPSYKTKSFISSTTLEPLIANIMTKIPELKAWGWACNSDSDKDDYEEGSGHSGVITREMGYGWSYR